MLAWLALGALMGLVGATALQDLQRKLLGLDEADQPTLSTDGERSALERQVEALRAQGERAGQRRDYATAIKAYRHAIVISPREELIDALAALHMKRGGPDDAQDAAFLYVRMSERAPAERVRPLLERALECEQALRALQALRDETEQGPLR